MVFVVPAALGVSNNRLVNKGEVLMKTRSMILSMVLLVALAPVATTQDRTLTVAVFDFECHDEVLGDAGPQTASMLNALLSVETGLILVERAELQKVLAEQELGISGTVSTESAAKVGQLTGAKVLVIGRAFKAGKDTVLVAKIIGTETSRVYGEMVKSATVPVSDLATELAGKIAQTVLARGDTLVARQVSREDRVATIQKSLGDRRRPVVSMNIPERHFGGPTFDPAVETEFGKILTECGFTLVVEKTEAKPRFELLGEAFSEFGMRRGNLVSCKGRVEVKVRDIASGEWVVVDRQVAVAIDLSEQIAAKCALQDAAAQLAERVLPKLAL
jgi:hypothetical protein